MRILRNGDGYTEVRMSVSSPKKQKKQNEVCVQKKPPPNCHVFSKARAWECIHKKMERTSGIQIHEASDNYNVRSLIALQQQLFSDQGHGESGA